MFGICFIDKISPEAVKNCHQVIDLIRSVVEREVKGVTVHPYGSAVSGCSLKTSDIDVTVCFSAPDDGAKDALSNKSTLDDILQKIPFFLVKILVLVQ